MRALRAAAALLAAVAAAAPARAETTNVAPTGFVVTFQREVDAPRERLWTVITQLPAWWDDEHTFSGKAANMRLDLRAGGCWCETWDTGSVLHGTVAYVVPGKTVRFYASLGPLQDRATAGVLTFAIRDAGAKSTFTLTYKVAGPPDAGLVELAPKVDRVLGEQVQRLVRFTETGKAD